MGFKAAGAQASTHEKDHLSARPGAGQEETSPAQEEDYNEVREGPADKTTKEKASQKARR